jgi:signal transduction histidine kinase
VFDRFYRGGPAAAGGGGTGLGLAIARWAVALHGGRIGLADDTGSRFIVDLPGRPEEAA